MDQTDSATAAIAASDAAGEPAAASVTLQDIDGDKRLPLIAIVLSLLIFIVMLPFASTSLPRVDAFVPIYQSALIISDLITAVLLFRHFVAHRSHALLALACGYLFTAAMAAAHLLTFPGLFSPTGLLGAGSQTTAWLYMFWHGGFPLAVIAYALLKRSDSRNDRQDASSSTLAMLVGIAGMFAAVAALIVLATGGRSLLPDIMDGDHYTPAMIVVVCAVWMASFVALLMLWLRRPLSRLDTWLVVVMCAWCLDIALSAVFNAGRFDLGFYAGRICGLLAATVVLLGLLFETGALHAKLTRLLAAGEAALRHEIEENSRIFETSLDLIMITDRRGRILRISPSARTILGYSPEEMVSRSGGDFVFAGDLDAVRDQMRLARRGKLMRHFETRYLRKDGRLVSLAWSGVWSEPEQRHFFIGRDMTESERAREALHESEQMALVIIDSAIDGFVQLDSAGIVLDWNRQSEVMFERPRDEAIGLRFADFAVPPDKRSGFPQRLGQFVAASGLTVPVQRYESRSLRRDGREFPVEVSVTALRRGEGYVFNAFVRDLTEKIKIEQQFRQAQKMEAIGQLTGGLAHDFNNLLAIVIGNLDLLSESQDMGPEQKQLVEEAVAAALSGSELTRRLLAFARRQPLQAEVIDLNELIEDLTKLLSRTLGENIEVNLDLDPTIPRIAADRVQLETAIANLANNARDAMPNGGRLFITTRSSALDADYAAQHVDVEPGNYVAIEISDTGTGITPDIVTRVFEPFFTTKEVGKGTGLGLSMVFGFMKQSRGHINVYSELGKGTTFRLYLRPAEGLVAGPMVEAPPMQPAIDVPATVLVVEDNSRLRDVVVRQLKGLGLAVLEAEHAAQALERLAVAETVDLVFSDVVLPGGMDGIALTREIVKRHPQSKILLTSGFPGKRLADADGLGNAVRLLSKPYRKADLTKAVREALNDRQAAAV
jgi:PAS domain S-box-containing protein